MSQHDLTIDNQGFPAFRADLNNALQALGTLQSGATAPSTTFAYMPWLDTSSTAILKIRNSANTDWIDTGIDFSKGGVVYTDAIQSFTAPQRVAVTTDNDLSFDLSVGQAFDCTPTGTGTLTFTNIPAASTTQAIRVKLTNGANHAISAAATTKISADDLTTISATGVYILVGYTDGTNVYIAGVSGDLT